MTHADLPDNWDEELTALGGTVLQSSAWAAFQTALDRKVIWDRGDGWCWLAIVRKSRGGSYLDVPWGPTLDNKEASLSQAIQSLAEAARTQKVDFVRVEPTGAAQPDMAKSLGLIKVTSVQPEFPWVLDLTQLEQALRRGLTSGHRSAINGAERRGLSFRLAGAGEIESFLNLMHQTASRQKFAAHPDNYYQTMLKVMEPLGAAKLYLAEAQQQVVAAAIVFDFGGVRYYAHAGADQVKNRQLQASAPLVWRMITDCKAAGGHEFNFWGVTTSSDPKDAWAGFTKFKTAFGGSVRPRIGTWELPLSMYKYRLLQLARKVL